MSKASPARRHIVWGTFDTGKPRVRMLVAAMRDIDPNVPVYHRSPWTGIEDKTQVKGVLAKLSILVRWLLAYPPLILAYLRAPAHDTVVVPYPGNLDVLILWPFAKMRGARICWDMFISIYDTAVIDRQMASRHGIVARILYAFEWLSTRAAAIVLMDTQEHAHYVAELYRLPQDRVRSVWVGVEDQTFARATAMPATDVINVLFYGQFIPLHGIDTIIEAIGLIEARAEKPAMRFVIVGSGQEAARIDRAITARGFQSIERIKWVDYTRLQELIARSAICLGVFANNGKAQRVIPNKVFQILSVGRPLVTMDSPAIREIVRPGKAVRLVVPGDAHDLAETLVQLARELQTGTHGGEVLAAALRDLPVAGIDVVRDQLAMALEIN